MNEFPKISVVVPVYGVERYLEKCVASLRNQTLTDIEIILVDDESRDRCPEICDSLAREDSRIKVIHKRNEGLGLTCNAGLEIASGEYVAFCDSDDWIDADCYERMLRAAEKNNADMVMTGLKRVDDDGNIIDCLAHPEVEDIYDSKESLLELALELVAAKPANEKDRNIQVSAKTVLYRRSMLENNNIRFVSERQYTNEDLIFNISAILASQKVVVLPEYFYNYRYNPESISSTVQPDKMMRIMDGILYAREILLDNTGHLKNFDLKEMDVRVSRFLIGEARSLCGLIMKSRMPHYEKYNQIRKIVYMQNWQEIAKTYPVSQMPLKHKIVFRLFQLRAVLLLMILLKLH